MTHTFTLTTPDDWHCHLRDYVYLERTVHDTAHQFHRAVVMPNLQPPVTTLTQACAYQQRILAHVPTGKNFTPLMTMYLTHETSPQFIANAKKSGVITAVKYYPAGATTHSDAGIADVRMMYDIFDAMQSVDLPLSIHGETIAPGIDIFDREKIFIEEILSPMVKQFPKLRIILEHISTKAAVDFVMFAPKTVSATITPHHLHYTRNDIFHHGIRPHYFCMPILKRVDDQRALIAAAISGNPKFFLGTDSAPHAREKKEQACGCAGIYSAHAAIELYAQIFEAANALDQLENFASVFGALFYHLPVNTTQITLIKKPWKIAETLSFGNTQLIPMKAGETLSWQIAA